MNETFSASVRRDRQAANTFRVIAAYKFLPLSDLLQLREILFALCAGTSIKGTFLLSPEGINLFLSGTTSDIDALLSDMRALPGLDDLAAKVSECAARPFQRLKIKIKSQIIAFDDTTIDPARRTAPKVSAKTLKQWLDEGRPLTLLDTRNDYEVRMGTFTGAIDPGIATFRDFPRAVARLSEALKSQPLVIFCTGGIRCEKAGPYLEQQGFSNVLQLDGGILKYFEECGSAHYQGDCYVFDDRVAVDATLRETNAAL